MKIKLPHDDDLGPLLGLVVFALSLAVVYLVISLPFAANSGEVTGAIVALTTLIGSIVGVRIHRRSKNGSEEPE